MYQTIIFPVISGPIIEVVVKDPSCCGIVEFIQIFEHFNELSFKGLDTLVTFTQSFAQRLPRRILCDMIHYSLKLHSQLLPYTEKKIGWFDSMIEFCRCLQNVPFAFVK